VARLVTDAETRGTALVECEARNEGAPITVFEIETAAAFLLFNPAIQLMSCFWKSALGGRLDATNCHRPVRLRPVITPVSLDHADLLGDTIVKIAAEKAGILKTRCTRHFWQTQQREGAWA